jgi:hypothetical protein
MAAVESVKLFKPFARIPLATNAIFTFAQGCKRAPDLWPALYGWRREAATLRPATVAFIRQVRMDAGGRGKYGAAAMLPA